MVGLMVIEWFSWLVSWLEAIKPIYHKQTIISHHHQLLVNITSCTPETPVVMPSRSPGILTTTGGMTSHAAVVARGMGRPCVVGAGRGAAGRCGGLVMRG